MAFRPPRLRTPPHGNSPRPHLHRTRDTLLYLILALCLCLCLVFIYWSSNHEVSRIVMNFVTRASDPDGTYHPPLLVVHGGADRAITPAVMAQLSAWHVGSVSNQLRLMCGMLPAVEPPLSAEQIHFIRRVLKHPICRVDFDIFFTKDQSVMIGHPHRVATAIYRHRLQTLSGGAATAATDPKIMSEARAEIAAIEADIGRVRITRAEVEAADAAGQVSQPLERVLEVFAEFIGTHANTWSTASLNNTRATFEVKYFPQSGDPMMLHRLMQWTATAVEKVSKWAKRKYPAAIVQTPSASDSNGSAPPITTTTHTVFALQEYVWFIVEPMRYLSHWEALMSMPKRPIVVDNVIVRPTVNLTGIELLATEPQIRYVLPLRDVALEQLREDGLRTTRQLPFLATDFCRYLLVPPPWVSVLMPSIEALRRCTKWYDVDLHGVNAPQLQVRTSGLKLKKAMQRHPVGATWKQAMAKVDRHIPLITWLADTWPEYRSVVELGSFTGLRSTFVVSNAAQDLLHKAQIYD